MNYTTAYFKLQHFTKYIYLTTTFQDHILSVFILVFAFLREYLYMESIGLSTMD